MILVTNLTLSRNREEGKAIRCDLLLPWPLVEKDTAYSRLCAEVSPLKAVPSAHLAWLSRHRLLERQVVDLVLTENLNGVFREQGALNTVFNLGSRTPGLQGGHALENGNEE